MTGNDWTEIIGAIGVFALVITVITTIIIQVARTSRAKATLARESEYRNLAETAIHTQEGIERQLTKVAGRLADMESRMASLERTCTHGNSST